MSKPHRHRKAVAISDLAEMGFCERKALMKAKYGDCNTPESAKRRAEGSAQHAAFDEQVRRHHNDQGTRDTRCFIATAIYGGLDPRTEELRDFRDQVLLGTTLGSIAVRTYYTISPVLARWLHRHPAGKPVVTWVLDQVRMYIRHGRARSST